MDMTSRQGVQHDIHALSVGRRHQFVVPVETVRIKGCPHTKRPQLRALFLGSGSGVDLRPHMLGQSDGGLPHSPHCRMDQDPRPLSQTGQMDQRVVRGDIDRQRCCGLVHVDGVGLAEYAVLAGHHPIGDAAPLNEGHPVSDAVILDCRPDTTDDPAPFHADLVPQG